MQRASVTVVCPPDWSLADMACGTASLPFKPRILSICASLSKLPYVARPPPTGHTRQGKFAGYVRRQIPGGPAAVEAARLLSTTTADSPRISILQGLPSNTVTTMPTIRRAGTRQKPAGNEWNSPLGGAVLRVR